MRVHEARLRALGLDLSETSPGMLRALRPDFLGSWLPYALADIFNAVVSSGGAKAPRTAEVLASWGLSSLANGIEDAETDNALGELVKLQQVGDDVDG